MLKVNEIEEHHKIDNLRSSLNYDINGLVFKVNDLKLQNRLGNTSNSPKGYSLQIFCRKSSYKDQRY